MTAKEYWNKAEQLRKRINRKIHEIYVLRQRAEGMNGIGMSDMPKTVSPEPNKIENAVCKIITLEEEIRETQEEYDSLVINMQNCIQQIEDEDARDLLMKRYIEFKPWQDIMCEMGYSESSCYRLHRTGLSALKS